MLPQPQGRHEQGVIIAIALGCGEHLLEVLMHIDPMHQQMLQIRVPIPVSHAKSQAGLTQIIFGQMMGLFIAIGLDAMLAAA